MHRFLKVSCLLILFSFSLSFFPHVTEDSFVVTKINYSVTVIIEGQQYKDAVCRRLVQYALDYIPQDWWKQVRSIRFSSKDRMAYFGVTNAVACFSRGKKEVVVFSNLKEISPNFFYEIVIHEYAHAVDPDSARTWSNTLKWDLVQLMWEKGEFLILPIEITEKLKDDMCEYWAEIVEDVLQNPVSTKKESPLRYAFFKKFMSATASPFDPIKNHTKMIATFNVQAELLFRADCVWGTVVAVDTTHITLRQHDKLVKLEKGNYTYPDSFASYGLPMNLSELSCIITGCRWACIHHVPKVGDTVLVFQNKLFLTTPYSSARDVEHRILCTACKKK